MSVSSGGRLTDKLPQAMLELNASVEVDRELWRQDIQGSLAHTRGLEHAGVISSEEAEELCRGLREVEKEIEDGKFEWKAEREDVHMNIEARLSELIGPLGGKLHTARSRNDQVATDLRLWCRSKSDALLNELGKLALVIVERAEEHIDVLMPAYTHLQRGPAESAFASSPRLARNALTRRGPHHGCAEAAQRVSAGGRGSGRNRISSRSRAHSPSLGF